jgi:hypothetical protein
MDEWGKAGTSSGADGSRRRGKRTCSLILLSTPCLRRCAAISTTSPNQEGVEETDSEEVWMLTDPSAILVICTSLREWKWFFSLREAHFYPYSPQLNSSLRIAWDQYHFGGKPPASYTEGELRREKFPACRQLQATCKPYLCDLFFERVKNKSMHVIKSQLLQAFGSIFGKGHTILLLYLRRTQLHFYPGA